MPFLGLFWAFLGVKSVSSVPTVSLVSVEQLVHFRFLTMPLNGVGFVWFFEFFDVLVA